MAEKDCYDSKETTGEENDFDAKATMAPEEGSVDTLPIVKAVEPQVVKLRRHSTGASSLRPGNEKVQSRYLGNHVSSTHDICKHGKRCEDDVVKPWKPVRKMSIEGADVRKIDAFGARRKSLGGRFELISGSRSEKPENSPPAKGEAVVVVEKPYISLNSESSGSKETDDAVKPCDGSSAKRIGEKGKNNETKSSLSDSHVTRTVDLKNNRTNAAVKKFSKVSSAITSKDETSSLKKVKQGHKAKVEPVNNEDVPGKTLYIVEDNLEKRNIKEVEGETHRPSSSRKITRSSKNNVESLKDMSSSSPISEDKGSSTTKSEYQSSTLSSKAKTSSTKPSLHRRKKSVSLNFTTDSISESKNKPKKIGTKLISLTKQLSFKRGKVLDPESKDPTPTSIQFRKRKNSLRNKQNSTGRSSSTGHKLEKVVLRHRTVDKKKKIHTSFNNMIEETVNKLAVLKKSKVKALVGAFETVISHQDKKSSRKRLTQATTSVV